MGEGGDIVPPVEKRGWPGELWAAWWEDGTACGSLGLPGFLRRAQKKREPFGFLFLLADHFLLAFSFSSRSRSCSAVMA